MLSNNFVEPPVSKDVRFGSQSVLRRTTKYGACALRNSSRACRARSYDVLNESKPHKVAADSPSNRNQATTPF
jgi:hypothetical protein